MFNLVQLQERLKMYPQQVIDAYANGANPYEVPPFMALTENLRRKKILEEEQAKNAQATEGAPNIKDKLSQEVMGLKQAKEQAAGLMALQGNRQRQAAQQQAGVQAAMPMAAPNTTTSEPAQLAGGGFIDDIVVPRDYQAGGPVSPAMLQALAKARAMRRPRGLSGLPMRPDMFRRGDYAGGGIVAFEAGGQVKRVSGKTLSEYMASVADTLNAMPQLTEQEKIDRMNLARQQFMQSPADAGSGTEIGLEGRTASGLPREARGSRPGQVTPPDLSNLEGFFGRSRTAGSAAPGGVSALSKALGIDPSRYFEAKDPRSVEAIMADRKRLQGLAGISEEYLDERERRLAELQARREGVRAGQPMEQLTSFLTSIAEGPRGGTFGTQGARGARASRELRAQQEALRDKQDMEMEELKFATAAKRDAVRRGDLGEAERLRTKEEELKRDMLKNQADLIRGQAQLETQGRQVEYYGQQVARPTDFERQKELYLQHIRETGEKPTAAGFQKFVLGSKASTVMTMEDAIRLATTQLGAGASIQEIQQRAMELMRLGAGGASPASSGNRPPLSSFQK